MSKILGRVILTLLVVMGVLIMIVSVFDLVIPGVTFPTGSSDCAWRT